MNKAIEDDAEAMDMVRKLHERGYTGADVRRAMLRPCTHEGYSFKQHGRCCHQCGAFMVDWGD